MATPAPSAFPSDLPPRQQPTTSGSTWKNRNCPNARTCWSFSWHAFSLRTSDKAVLARRICMITILAVRTALSVLAIISRAWGVRILSLIIGVILGVLGFFFIAWCLAMCGEVMGVRKVLGLRIGRWHYDVFLFVVALLHIAMIIAYPFGFVGTGLGSTWIIMWLLLFGAAWVATWQPENEEVYV